MGTCVWAGGGGQGVGEGFVVWQRNAEEHLARLCARRRPAYQRGRAARAGEFEKISAKPA